MTPEDGSELVPDTWFRAITAAMPGQPPQPVWRRDEPPGLVHLDAELAVLDQLVAATGDLLAPVKVGLAHNPKGGSVLSYICLSASTLGDVMTAARRYLPLTRPRARMHLVPDGDGVWMRFSNTDPRVHHHGPHAEFAMAAVTKLLRVASGREDLPDAVEFAHLRRAGVADTEAQFGCSVQFGAAQHGVRLPDAALSAPLVSRDAALQAHLTSYGDLLLLERHPAEPGLVHLAEAAILTALPRAAPTLESTAAEVGVSPRTLRRRLAAEGLSFRHLLDDLRRMLARAYLADPEISLAEVAFLLGFAEQSSFTTAHRRWTGQSPSEARSAALRRSSPRRPLNGR